MTSLKPKKIILLGASTGGPGLIEQIITVLKPPLNASIIISQHMESHHLHSFAKRIQRISPFEIIFASESQELLNGKIYILEDTTTLHLKQGKLFLQKESIHKGYYHPTIDALFFSASELYRVEIVTYLLSGIGADGAKGMLSLKEANYKTVAQDENTSIVYGMPKVAFDIGATTDVMSIQRIMLDVQKEMT